MKNISSVVWSLITTSNLCCGDNIQAFVYNTSLSVFKFSYNEVSMAERKIDMRKSQLFLHSFVPVVNTHEELVKQNFALGKFPFTITGIIKLTGIVWVNIYFR